MSEKLEDGAGELVANFGDQNRLFSEGFEGTAWSKDAIADHVEVFQANLARSLEAAQRPADGGSVPTRACD